MLLLLILLIVELSSAVRSPPLSLFNFTLTDDEYLASEYFELDRRFYREYRVYPDKPAIPFPKSEQASCVYGDKLCSYPLHSTCFDVETFKFYLYPSQGTLYDRALYDLLKLNAARTSDPSEACLFIVAQDTGTVNIWADVNETETYLNSLPYWDGGRNHLLFILSDHAPPYNVGKAMMAVSSSVFPDTKSNPLLDDTFYGFHHLRPNYDISIPPLFYALNFSQTMTEWYNSLYSHFSRYSNIMIPSQSNGDRPYLLGAKGSSYVYSPLHPSRARLYLSLFQDSDINVNFVCLSPKYLQMNPLDEALCNRMLWKYPNSSSFDDVILRSKFAAIVPGEGVFSYRMIEAIRGGSIPVLIGPYPLVFSELFDWKEFAVVWEDDSISGMVSLIRHLRTIDESTRQRMLRRLQAHYNTYFATPQTVISSILEVILKRNRNIRKAERAHQKQVFQSEYLVMRGVERLKRQVANNNANRAPGSPIYSVFRGDTNRFYAKVLDPSLQPEQLNLSRDGPHSPVTEVDLGLGRASRFPWSPNSVALSLFQPRSAHSASYIEDGKPPRVYLGNSIYSNVQQLSGEPFGLERLQGPMRLPLHLFMEQLRGISGRGVSALPASFSSIFSSNSSRNLTDESTEDDLHLSDAEKAELFAPKNAVSPLTPLVELVGKRSRNDVWLLANAELRFVVEQLDILIGMDNLDALNDPKRLASLQNIHSFVNIRNSSAPEDVYTALNKSFHSPCLAEVANALHASTAKFARARLHCYQQQDTLIGTSFPQICAFNEKLASPLDIFSPLDFIWTQHPKALRTLDLSNISLPLSTRKDFPNGSALVASDGVHPSAISPSSVYALLSSLNLTREEESALLSPVFDSLGLDMNALSLQASQRLAQDLAQRHLAVLHLTRAARSAVDLFLEHLSLSNMALVDLGRDHTAMATYEALWLLYSVLGEDLQAAAAVGLWSSGRLDSPYHSLVYNENLNDHRFHLVNELVADVLKRVAPTSEKENSPDFDFNLESSNLTTNDSVNASTSGASLSTILGALSPNLLAGRKHISSLIRRAQVSTAMYGSGGLGILRDQHPFVPLLGLQQLLMLLDSESLLEAQEGQGDAALMQLEARRLHQEFLELNPGARSREELESWLKPRLKQILRELSSFVHRKAIRNHLGYGTYNTISQEGNMNFTANVDLEDEDGEAALETVVNQLILPETNVSHRVLLDTLLGIPEMERNFRQETPLLRLTRGRVDGSGKVPLAGGISTSHQASAALDVLQELQFHSSSSCSIKEVSMLLPHSHLVLQPPPSRAELYSDVNYHKQLHPDDRLRLGSVQQPQTLTAPAVLCQFAPSFALLNDTHLLAAARETFSISAFLPLSPLTSPGFPSVPLPFSLDSSVHYVFRREEKEEIFRQKPVLAGGATSVSRFVPGVPEALQAQQLPSRLLAPLRAAKRMGIYPHVLVPEYLLQIISRQLVTFSKEVNLLEGDNPMLALPTQMTLPEALPRSLQSFLSRHFTPRALESRRQLLVQRDVNSRASSDSSNMATSTERAARIAIVSLCAYNSSQTALGDLSIENFRRYCHLHDYDCFLASDRIDPVQSLPWSKVALVYYFLDKYDWVMWKDCDSFIMNPSIKVQDLVVGAQKAREVLAGGVSQFLQKKDVNVDRFWKRSVGGVEVSPSKLNFSSMDEGEIKKEQNRTNSMGKKDLPCVQAVPLPPAPIDLIISRDSTIINSGIFLMRSSTWSKQFLESLYGGSLPHLRSLLHNSDVSFDRGFDGAEDLNECMFGANELLDQPFCNGDSVEKSGCFRRSAAAFRRFSCDWLPLYDTAADQRRRTANLTHTFVYNGNLLTVPTADVPLFELAQVFTASATLEVVDTEFASISASGKRHKTVKNPSFAAGKNDYFVQDVLDLPLTNSSVLRSAVVRVNDPLSDLRCWEQGKVHSSLYQSAQFVWSPSPVLMELNSSVGTMVPVYAANATASTIGRLSYSPNLPASDRYALSHLAPARNSAFSACGVAPDSYANVLHTQVIPQEWMNSYPDRRMARALQDTRVGIFRTHTLQHNRSQWGPQTAPPRSLDKRSHSSHLRSLFGEIYTQIDLYEKVLRRMERFSCIYGYAVERDSDIDELFFKNHSMEGMVRGFVLGEKNASLFDLAAEKPETILSGLHSSDPTPAQIDYYKRLSNILWFSNSGSYVLFRGEAPGDFMTAFSGYREAFDHETGELFYELYARLADLRMEIYERKDQFVLLPFCPS